MAPAEKKTLNQKINALQFEATAQKKARELIMRELKNERRKRQRLMAKTKGLSSKDLLDLLTDRAGESGGSDSVSSSPAGSSGDNAGNGGSAASGSASSSTRAA